MEHAISIADSRVETANPSRFVMDTTFVLFFLAMDMGASFGGFGFEMILSVLTLAMFVTAPYLLQFAGEKPEFKSWAIGRVFIAMIAVVTGLSLKSAAGTVLPEAVKYVPMILLIVAGIFCTSTQIYGMMRFRLAR